MIVEPLIGLLQFKNRMPTLHVFGDSYVAPWYQLHSWVNVVAKTLNMHYMNNGVCGSSVEFSFKSFLSNIENNNIKDNDIIIFQFSNVGRLHFIYHNRNPGEAGKMTFPTFKDEPLWYTKNKQCIKWYLTNRDEDLLKYQAKSYLNTLYLFAQENPTIKVVVLYNQYFNPLFKLGYLNNFLNTEISLHTVSSNEIINYTSYLDFITFYGGDIRLNHLTIPNLNILSKLVIEIIQSNSIDNFTINKFKKNIIQVPKSKEDIQKMIKQKLIFPGGEFQEWL